MEDKPLSPKCFIQAMALLAVAPSYSLLAIWQLV